MIQTLENRAIDNDLHSSAFYSEVEKAVQKCVSEPHCIDPFATRMIYAIASTFLVATFVKQDVEKRYLDNFNMEKLLNKLAATVNEKKIKVEKRT